VWVGGAGMWCLDGEARSVVERAAEDEEFSGGVKMGKGVVWPQVNLVGQHWSDPMRLAPWLELQSRLKDPYHHSLVAPQITTTMFALKSSASVNSRQFQRFLALPAGIRHASSTPPPKPRLLEKPERFNPPSHPSRLRSKHRSYGAPLAEHERRAQKTRSYPHMMPAEGTFTFWFLTNRRIHLWISMVCI
jgi:hypothetical protein